MLSFLMKLKKTEKIYEEWPFSSKGASNQGIVIISDMDGA